MYKTIISFLLCLLLFSACKKETASGSFSFEKGQFITYLENKKDSSSFYRVDNLQIETYKNKIDTFTIDWKSKFEFHLLKLHPKTKLDSTKFVVKITKIKNNAYEFQANYRNSNFKQKGTTIKTNN
tara:strand:- start:146 stop:523 length:378 start_codon:yes stop_codon:yes gene_type:complete